MKKMMAVMLAVLAIASAVQAQFELISDDFNRVSGTNLGATAEGYAWTRYYSDGDSKLIITNNTMLFNAYGGLVYAAGAPKYPDFVLDVDLARPATVYNDISFFDINFRGIYGATTIAAGGVVDGYKLRVYMNHGTSEAYVQLLEDSDYQGTILTSTNVSASASGFHVTLTADGSLITAAINGTEVLSYDASGDANLASDGSSTYGYINFNAVNNRVWSMDNLAVTTIPPDEPILVSDGFNRASGTNLGTTAEGFAWTRYYSPDDSKLTIDNNAMLFNAYGGLVYLAGSSKYPDFVMDVDLARPATVYNDISYFDINFRGIYGGTTIASTGVTDGYKLRVYMNHGTSEAYAALMEDTDYQGTILTSTNVSASVSGFHVTLTADGSLITAAINGTEIFSYNAAGDANLASSGSSTYGYINFNAANNRAWSMDNLLVTEPPYVPGGYDTWAIQFGGTNVIGAATNDYDGDGLINLYEYGLGGNPTNALDQGTSPQYGLVEQGGTTYFGYVYPQLTDTDSGLSYWLETCTNLVSGAWTNAGYTVLGTNLVGGMNMVSNYTDTVDSQKFIRLMISTNTP